MVMGKLTIGTRGSALALAQTNYVLNLLKKHYPDIMINVKIIKTTGDIQADAPLHKIGGKGVFLKEIEEALLQNEIDIAVHSMKDVPLELPIGLSIVAMPQREDPRDAFICKIDDGWHKLPADSIVGTSSLRRSAQILSLRPHWSVKLLRGNIDTRWKKFEHGDYDAIILAMAGLKRLGLLSEFVYPLEISEFIPAIGQGALGIEVVNDKLDIKKRIAIINDPNTYICVSAERIFLKTLGGNCYSSIGAHAMITDNKIFMIGFVASSDGKELLCEKITSEDIYLYEQIAMELAEKLISKGALNFINSKIE